ncbi:LacI family DNA-binding transcriptional regulator [Pseudactinotalea sp. Z1748]|uniref:LacI family DNA-binding transcriptional regulator n=1 Tax=Pseudactinotalea sp. Z1748 TaxID=3413027 RepID=UPI003C79F3F9
MSEGKSATKRPTVRDIAAHAGVSVATVSRILNGAYQAPQATHEKVMRAVQDLDYRTSTTRALTTLTGTIAVGIPHMRSQYYMAIGSGIEEQARTGGLGVLLSTTAGHPEQELQLVDMMLQRGVEAVILIGGIEERAEHRAALANRAHALARGGSRLVLCGRPWQGPPDAPVSVVNYDAEAAGYAATTYLLSNGHRRIAHLGGPNRFATGMLRARGYRRALDDFGVEFDESLIATAKMDREAGIYYGRKFLTETDATAIFAANDEQAAGIIAAARAEGRSMPEELSLMGFDDTLLARDLYPALTSLHVPQLEMGRAAARMAMYRDDQAEQRLEIGTHVVVRDSVRRVALN